MDPTNEMYRDRYVPEATPRQGFWRRQFSGDTTGDQLAFDVIFGVILPIGCLIFDPIVFRSGSGFGGGGLLAEYRILAYAFIGFQILMLGLCLLAGRRLRGAGAVMSGALFSGSLAALAIGVALFPLSFFGLMFLNNRDYVMVQGIVTVFALIVVGVSFIIDIVTALIDPRVRYS